MNDNFPEFSDLVLRICQKNPLQNKAIRSFLNNRDNVFWKRAETFASKFITFLELHQLSRNYAVDCYLKMCRDMLTEQIRFKKSGSYSLKTADQAEADIYSSEEEMASYVYAIALSFFLWPNHYAMYDFFIKESKKIHNIESYLEIGPGHGLYLARSINFFPNAEFSAIDISPISKRITEALVSHFTGNTKCEFHLQDINEFDGSFYDYIVVGEVLEHLDDPLFVLKKLRDMLSENGRMFLTTCANCPAIDHIYLYDSVAAIRDQVEKAGFKILVDLPLAVGDYPECEWDDKKVEVNYAAMVQGI